MKRLVQPLSRPCDPLHPCNSLDPILDNGLPCCVLALEVDSFELKQRLVPGFPSASAPLHPAERLP